MVSNGKSDDDKKKSLEGHKTTSSEEFERWLKERQEKLKIVHTTQTPSGQIIDWVPIESQDPNGIATPPPTPHISITHDSNIPRFETEDNKIERGPQDTVPILRPNISSLYDVSLEQYLSKKGGQHVNKHRQSIGASDPNPFGYFHVTSGQTVNLFGCEHWINLWDPFVENYIDHSIMQCGLQNYDQQTQSIEAGWTVDQSLNGDKLPHLFIYYTTNGYTKDGDNLGGYNRLVKGWVQYDNTIFPGAGWNGISTQGGTQYGFSMKWQLWQSNWWLAVQGRWIGYYPASLFMRNNSILRTIVDHAEWVGFWGEVYSSLSNPNLTRTKMGSGLVAEYGWTHACFQKNLRNQIDINGNMANHNGFGSVDSPSTAMYDLQMHMNSGTDWGSYFYGGGPGHI